MGGRLLYWAMWGPKSLKIFFLFLQNANIDNFISLSVLLPFCPSGILHCFRWTSWCSSHLQPLTMLLQQDQGGTSKLTTTSSGWWCSSSKRVSLRQDGILSRRRLLVNSSSMAVDLRIQDQVERSGPCGSETSSHGWTRATSGTSSLHSLVR